jgi:hypothetical protein
MTDEKAHPAQWSKNSSYDYSGHKPKQLSWQLDSKSVSTRKIDRSDHFVQTRMDLQYQPFPGAFYSYHKQMQFPDLL